MGISNKIKRRANRRGGALLLAIVAVVVLAGMAGAMMAVSGAFQHESVSAAEDSRALYVAEAGLADGIAMVQAARPTVVGVPTLYGDPAPIAFGEGGYSGSATLNADNTVTVTAEGTVLGRTRALEAVMGPDINPIYNSALFAGNSTGDPLYDMDFGGTGSQADEINGNVYSGGNVVVTGDASLNGAIKAAGAISGVSGGTSGTLPVPDIPGMNYAVNHDYDVAAMFSGASYKSNSLGGSAWELPAASPAHIFRKNPSDRSTDTSKTVKDDYFLEDPYESVNSSSSVTAANATDISLAGGTSGKVFYIDGNLWIHNRKIYSFALNHASGGAAQVTLVVNGNIYFSDNILYNNPSTDAVAFVAIKDAGEPDSGNIYFGDPTFGTLEQMDAFMYAENNFYDNNLSASGSAKVTVNGNMTAGNQVLINRDYGSQHSKLTVNFDDRISTGAITLPGLPGSNGAGADWIVLFWHEVAAP